jgi:putative hydrolases of HD superfamily
MSTKRDLEFLYEIGCLRFIPRAWVQFFGPDFQNLAEHHLRVIWIALMLSRYEGKVNTEKILKMALMHDLAESRAGDVHYVSRMYTKRNENLAIDDITKDTIFEQELKKLWKEYEERKTIESKIVKDADTLDVDLEVQEQEMKGQKHTIVWKSERKQFVPRQLYTKSAKKLWKIILNSKPYDWHINARNRVTHGDWKTKK